MSPDPLPAPARRLAPINPQGLRAREQGDCFPPRPRRDAPQAGRSCVPTMRANYLAGGASGSRLTNVPIPGSMYASFASRSSRSTRFAVT